MLEPKQNPTPQLFVDPPAWFRLIISRLMLGPQASESRLESRRRKAEQRRKQAGAPHVVDYFHQLDDPYSHLAIQVIEQFADLYDIKLNVHLIRATGGNSQPEFEKLAVWARRDAEWIAPHYQLSFPSHAGKTPSPEHQVLAGRALLAYANGEQDVDLATVSEALWAGDDATLNEYATISASAEDVLRALDSGWALLQERKD